MKVDQKIKIKIKYNPALWKVRLKLCMCSFTKERKIYSEFKWNRDRQKSFIFKELVPKLNLQDRVSEGRKSLQQLFYGFWKVSASR